MNDSACLRDLAAGDAMEPPYAFEEFECRRAASEYRRRTVARGVAAAVGVIALVALLALVTQSRGPVAELSVAAAPGPADTAEMPYQPALVDVGQFEVTSELEDHIALLDAEISAARVYSASPERLRQLESTRAQLNDSLQRVSFAQRLLQY
jgi:hypothetical protein